MYKYTYMAYALYLNPPDYIHKTFVIFNSTTLYMTLIDRILILKYFVRKTYPAQNGFLLTGSQEIHIAMFYAVSGLS